MELSLQEFFVYVTFKNNFCSFYQSFVILKKISLYFKANLVISNNLNECKASSSYPQGCFQHQRLAVGRLISQEPLHNSSSCSWCSGKVGRQEVEGLRQQAFGVNNEIYILSQSLPWDRPPPAQALRVANCQKRVLSSVNGKMDSSILLAAWLLIVMVQAVVAGV